MGRNTTGIVLGTLIDPSSVKLHVTATVQALHFTLYCGQLLLDAILSQKG